MDAHRFRPLWVPEEICLLIPSEAPLHANFIIAFSMVLVSLWLTACGDKPACVTPPDPRVFSSSLEQVEDFTGFYLVPQGDYASSQELSKEVVHSGSYAHKAWILSARDSTNDGSSYLPHRAYPTIQFHRTEDGIFPTPCLVTLWVYLEMDLKEAPPGKTDDWFSFATLSPDTSDQWARTVLVNLVHDGYLHLMHVPNQGEQEHLYQMDSIQDPQGLYASAHIHSGVIYNDDLAIGYPSNVSNLK